MRTSLNSFDFGNESSLKVSNTYQDGVTCVNPKPSYLMLQGYEEKVLV